MNRYRKGANIERKAINDHIKNGAIFAMRGAGSKCRGKLKVDVVALYVTPCSNGYYGTLLLEQYKKSKGNFKKEKLKFMRVTIPPICKVRREFIQIK